MNLSNNNFLHWFLTTFAYHIIYSMKLGNIERSVFFNFNSIPRIWKSIIILFLFRSRLWIHRIFFRKCRKCILFLTKYNLFVLKTAKSLLKNLFKNRFFWVHVLFWCLYASFFFYIITFPRRGVEPNYTRATLDAILQVITMAIISYYHYFKILPKVLEDRSLLQYAGRFLPILVPMVLVQMYGKRFIYMEASSNTIEFFSSTRFIVQHIFSVIFIVAFVSMLRLLKDWSEIQEKRKEIENQEKQSKQQ